MQCQVEVTQGGDLDEESAMSQQLAGAMLLEHATKEAVPVHGVYLPALGLAYLHTAPAALTVSALTEEVQGSRSTGLNAPAAPQAVPHCPLEFHLQVTEADARPIIDRMTGALASPCSNDAGFMISAHRGGEESLIVTPISSREEHLDLVGGALVSHLTEMGISPAVPYRWCCHRARY